ncbi:MAG: glycoside hydrolase family 32 protein [Eubacterium sp.]|nr:glycoside hydrolase family 32 protein [Eubacterium sp.]
MISQALRDARRYEEILEKQISPQERPAFHLTPRSGWMNDPNGFCWYHGAYHMFYQYYPYASHWDDMHWGHAVSRDLLHWEFLPAALAPDELYDRDGCFSGSAITLPDGRHLLMYTGVVNEKDRNGKTWGVQTQCVAIGDGIDYEKYEGNPVLTEKDLPEGASRFDFRDPKIIQKKDGSLLCLLGSRPADKSGQILLYGSKDGLHWEFRKVLIANNCRFGKMWECPDFFSLDGHQVLLTSPQDMLPEGFEYHNGNGTLCLIGSWDEDKEEFIASKDQSIDYGIDFYAPQTVETPDGRRIMIGWLQNWDACAIRDDEDPWAGQMSLPRELSIRDGRLYQAPIREIEELRSNRAAYGDVHVNGSLELENISGRCVELLVSVRPKDPANVYHKFSIYFAQNEQYHSTISYRPHEAVLKIDRKFSGSRRAIIHQRRCLVEESRNGEIQLRIILDRFSSEIFINDGRQVVSAAMYTPLDAEGMSFFADGEAVMDIVKYDLGTGEVLE